MHPHRQIFRRSIQLLAVILTALTAVTHGAAAQTASKPVDLVALAHWQTLPNQQMGLHIALDDLLTDKQQNMISGGFTTVSQLSLSMSPDPRDSRAAPFFDVRCSVKYDAWLETYDVARLDDNPQTALLKDFKDYSELCLNTTISTPAILNQFKSQGGMLVARLIVKQTSVEEASKIKEWLIQQQSGMMQGLFSHMLGELTLQQSLIVKVSVPPQPAVTDDKSKAGSKAKNESAMSVKP